MNGQPSVVCSEDDLKVESTTPVKLGSVKQITGIPTPPSEPSPSESLKNGKQSNIDDLARHSIKDQEIIGAAIDVAKNLEPEMSTSPLKMAIKLNKENPASSKTVITSEMGIVNENHQSSDITDSVESEDEEEEIENEKNEVARETKKKRQELLRVRSFTGKQILIKMLHIVFYF